eukprot:c57474_g1_i1 orf=10-171(+)
MHNYVEHMHASGMSNVGACTGICVFLSCLYIYISLFPFFSVVIFYFIYFSCPL